MKPRLIHLFTLFALLASLLGSAVTVTPVRAASLLVNSDADTVANDGVCTLREAITAANTDTASGAAAGECAAGSSADTITFDADYTITLTLGSQLPAVTSTIIINGNGAANTIIQASTCNPITQPGGCTPANRRVFQALSGSSLTLNQVTVRHGVCDGGCDSPSTVGGGISVLPSGALAINNSIVSANYSGDGGAGLHNSSGGTVTITKSTFADNSSSNAGAALTNQGDMMISNSTITNNAATGANNYAGGIRNLSTLNIYNSTVSGNTSTSAVFDGSNIAQDAGTLNLYNTIIANGTDGDCKIAGGTVSSTNSLIESPAPNACGLTNGSNGNIIGSDPALGSLIGSPAYFPLNVGSPAINKGSNAICAAAPVNNASQNGITRPQGALCDIGSFEFTETVAPTTAILTKPPVRTLATSATFTFSGTDNQTLPANLTFECKLDGGAFVPCTSPKNYNGLTAVKHTFSVRAKDEFGNVDATPATYAWTVQKERTRNGGFNTYVGASKIPQFWVKSAFAATDGKDTTVKKEGLASVKIIGAAGTTKTLTQTMNLSGVTGDKFTFSFWAKGATIPAAGLCRAQVLLFDGATLKLTKTIHCSTGTQANFQKKTLTFNATSNYTKAIIRFTYSKASGTVWFDLVSLIK